MLDEQTLIDLASSIGLLRPGGGANTAWFGAPLAEAGLALRAADNRERLVGALEALLEGLGGGPVAPDGELRFQVPELPLAITLRSTGDDAAGALRIGAALRFVLPGDQGIGGELALGLEVLEYATSATVPADNRFALLGPADLRVTVTGSLAGTPLFDALSIGASWAGGHLGLDFLVTPPGGEPLRLRFLRDGAGVAATGWEATLFQLGGALLAALAGRAGTLLATHDDDGNPDDAFALGARLLTGNLLPLLGWLPGTVPAGASLPEVTGVALPVFDPVRLARDPAAGLRDWLGALFGDAATRELHARAVLSWIAGVLSPEHAPSVRGLDAADERVAGFAASLHADGPGADFFTPELSLEVLRAPSGAARIEVGLGLRKEGGRIALTAQSGAGIDAVPVLSIEAALLTVPLDAPLDAAFLRVADGRIALAACDPAVHPGANAHAVFNLPGVPPGNTSIDWIGRVAAGLRFERGEALHPILEIEDLQIGTQHFARIDLLSPAALSTLGTSIAADAIADGLRDALGGGQEPIGDLICQLLGLTAPPNEPGWPLLVPAATDDPATATAKLDWLFRAPPQALAFFAFTLVGDGAGPRPIAGWLDRLGRLIERLHGSTGTPPAITGSGTSADPYRLPLFRPDAQGVLPLDVALCVVAEEDGAGGARRLRADVRLDVGRYALGAPGPLSVDAELILCDLVLARGGPPPAPTTARRAEVLPGGRLVARMAQAGRVSPDLLNPGPGRPFTVELGAFEIEASLRRGRGLSFDVHAEGPKVPDPADPQAPPLLEGGVFDWRDVTGAGDIAGSTGDLRPLLLGLALALIEQGQEDVAPGEEPEPDVVAVADAGQRLLGLAQFLGWIPQAMSPHAWPELEPQLRTLDGFVDFFGRRGLAGLAELLQRRLDPGAGPTGVGYQPFLDFARAWGDGLVHEHLNAPARALRRGFFGGADEPFPITLVRGKKGRPALQLLFWRDPNATPPYVALGLRALPAEKKQNDVWLEGALRVDLLHLEGRFPSWSVRPSPVKIEYELEIVHDGGVPLFVRIDQGLEDVVGSIRFGVYYDLDAGLRVEGSLDRCRSRAAPGSALEDYELDDLRASRLIGLMRNAAVVPFASGAHPAKLLFRILGAIGLFTAGAGTGPGNFLAEPYRRMRAIGFAAWMREQFTAPDTGILDLRALMRTLEDRDGNDESLLELVGLRREPNEAGLDLRLAGPDTLVFTRAEARTGGGFRETTRITWNAVTGAETRQVDWTLFGVLRLKTLDDRPQPRPITLTLPGVLGALAGTGEGLSIVPPDWAGIGIVLLRLGVLLGGYCGVWGIFQKWLIGRLGNLGNDTRAYLKEIGVLVDRKKKPTEVRLLNLFELAGLAGGWEGRIFARKAMERLDVLIGARTMARGHLLLASSCEPNEVASPPTPGAPPREAEPTDGFRLEFGTAEPGAHPAELGRLELGADWEIGLRIEAGGGWKDGRLDFDYKKTEITATFVSVVPNRFRLGWEATIDLAGRLRLDMLFNRNGGDVEHRVPVFPNLLWQVLASLVPGEAPSGREILALVFESLAYVLHDVGRGGPVPQDAAHKRVHHARDLVVHTLQGLGLVKTWDVGTGELEVDPERFQYLVRNGAPDYPVRFFTRMLDQRWLFEAVLDLVELIAVPQGGVRLGREQTTPEGTIRIVEGPSTRTPGQVTSDEQYLRWQILDRQIGAPGLTLTLALVLGNYTRPIAPAAPQYPTHPARLRPGFGVQFEIARRQAPPNATPISVGTAPGVETIFSIGHAEVPIVWMWLDSSTNPGKFRVDQYLPVEWVLPLERSRQRVRLTLMERLTAGSDGTRFSLAAGVQAGRRGDYRGLRVWVRPDWNVSAYCEDGEAPADDATEFQGELSLPSAVAALLVAGVNELALAEPSVADFRLSESGLPLGVVLDTIKDYARPRRSLIATDRNGVRVAGRGNVAHVTIERLIGDIIRAVETAPPPTAARGQKMLKRGGGRGGPGFDVSLASDGGWIGVGLRADAPVEVLPFADLVLEGDAGDAALKLWLVEVDPDAGTLRFRPGFEAREAGLRFHGRDERPLVEAGKLSLGAVSLLGAGAVRGDGDDHVGAKVALEHIGLPLGATRNETPASKMLAGDGANPAFSVAVKYEYDRKGDGLKVEFTGGERDAATGIIWFRVGRHTGVADIGRVGLLYPDAAAGPDHASMFIEGSFGAGPLQVGAEGFKLSAPIRNFWQPASWEVSLRGLSISYTTPALSLSGALERVDVPPGYVGAATLKLKPITLAALGAWNQITAPDGSREQSLMVFATVTSQKGLGGPPFFFVKGLAGGFGYNRALVVPPLDVIASRGHVLLDAMSGGDARTLMQAALRDLPPKLDAYWLAFGVSWTSLRFLEGRALLYARLDRGFTLGLLGKATLRQPEAPRPLVDLSLYLDAGFSTEGDDPRFWVQAQLADDSWALVPECRLSGGFALAAWPKRGDMVVTFGGYHPAFVRPAHYPTVPRVGLRFTWKDVLTVGGENYFAITPRELMVGSRIKAVFFKAGDRHPKAGVYADFEVGFDARLGWDPFFYDVHAFLHVHAELRDRTGAAWFALSIGADVWVWGPKFGGRALVSCGPFELDYTFGAPKALAQAPVKIADFASRQLLPGATAPLVPIGSTDVETAPRHRIADSLKVLASRGLLPTKQADGRSATSSIAVLPDFALDLRLAAPATSVQWVKGTVQAPAAQAVAFAGPDGASVSALPPVDLVPCQIADRHLPLFVRLKPKQPATAGPIDATSLPGASIRVETSGFPSASFDLAAVGRDDGAMTVPLVSRAELRFDVVVAPGRRFLERCETNLDAPGGVPAIPLAPAPAPGGAPPAEWARQLDRARARVAARRIPPSQLARKMAAAPADLAPRILADGPGVVARVRAFAAAPANGTPVPILAPTASLGARSGRVMRVVAPAPVKSARPAMTVLAGQGMLLDVVGPRGRGDGAVTLALDGDQAVRVAALDRAGAIALHTELLPGAGSIALPGRAHRVWVEGLGRLVNLTGRTSPAVPSGFAPVSRATPDGQLAGCGFDEASLLRHVDGGLFLARGAALLLPTGGTLRWPEGRDLVAANVLRRVRAVRLHFELGARTLLLHVRASVEPGAQGPGEAAGLPKATDLARAVQIALPPSARATAAVKAKVSGDEGTLYVPITAAADWACGVTLPPGVALRGAMWLPLQPDALAPLIAADASLRAVAPLPLSADGATRITWTGRS